MTYPALILYTKKARKLSRTKNILSLVMGAGTVKISLADLTVRQLACLLEEFVTEAKAIEPYASMPAINLDFDVNLLDNGRAELKLEIDEPEVPVVHCEVDPDILDILMDEL